MPVELSRIVTESSVGLGAVTYAVRTHLIVRPPGLFDTPGAVAGPGMTAALLGAIFGLSALPLWKRVGAFGFSAAGIAAIYLSQVRISLVVTVFMFGAYALALLAQKRVASDNVRDTGWRSSVEFSGAVTLGGQSITDRFTLSPKIRLRLLPSRACSYLTFSSGSTTIRLAPPGTVGMQDAISAPPAGRRCCRDFSAG